MGFISAVNRLISIYVESLRAVFRFKIWLPFFLLAVMQFLLLLLFRAYVHPVVYPILSPFVDLTGDNAAAMFARYPGLYIALPYVYQWGKLILGVLFEGLAVGFTAMLFLRHFGSRKGERIDTRFTFSRWPQLAIVWTIVTGLILAVNMWLPELFRDFLTGSPRRLMAFEIIMRLIAVAVYAVFIYAVPAIIVYRDNLLTALKSSFTLFFRYPVFTFFVALIPYLFTVPTSYLSSQSAMIATKFTPELVFYILTAGILVDMLVNFFLIGAVVNFMIEEGD